MADKIQILIEAILKKTTEQELENELRKIEKNLKPLKVDINSNAEAQIKLYKSLQKIYKEEEKQRLNQEKLSQRALAEKEKLLQYEQKVRMAIEKQKRKEEELNKILQERIVIYKQEAEAKLLNLKSRYGDLLNNTDIKKQIDAFRESLNNLNTNNFNVQKLNADFKTLEASVKNANAAVKATHRDVMTLGDMFKVAWNKMVIWAGAGTLLFGTLRQIKEGISYITELDNSLNEIRIVTNKTQQEVNNLALSYNKLAKEMNVTTKEVASTAADLFRQGLNDSQVEERMKAIIQYAKISGISLEESNKIITATANATGESVQKIIDIFALLGDETASGAEEIGEALQKVASTAENSGVSLEKAASWIATISSITRESASVIGTSLKSIISRYEQIKAKGFNEEDATQINDVTKALQAVGITAVDAQGQLRPIAEVLDELGAKWDGLTKNEKAYVSTALAGTYQRNRLITLLDNYSYSLKNYEAALNSAGTAEEKFAIYQESTQAKLDKFKATLESLYQNTLNSGFIKFVLDLGTGIVSLIDKIGLLNTAISGLIIYFTFFKTSSLFLPFINTATIAITKLTAGLNLSTAAAIKLNTVLGMLAPVAAFLAIQGLIKLFDSLIVTIDEQKEKVAEAKQEYESITSELSKLNEELEITNNRINELNSKDKLTLIEENELSKLKLTNEELEKRIALLEREQEIKEKQLAEEAQKLYEKQFGKYDFSQQQIDKYINDAKITGNYTALLREEHNVSALIAAYRRLLDLRKEALSSGNLEEVERLNDSLTRLEEQLINNAKELLNTKDILGSLKNPTARQKQILDEIEQGLNLINETIKKDSESFQESEDSLEQLNDALQKYEDNLKQLNDTINSVKSDLKTLNQVIADVRNGQSLSAEQILDLIEKYNLSADAIKKTTDGYTVELSALESVRKAKIQTALDSIEAEKQHALAVKEQVGSRLRNYGLEIEQLKNIAAVKAKLAEQADKEARQRANEITGGASDSGIRNRIYGQVYKEYMDKAGADVDLARKTLAEIEELEKKSKLLTTILNDGSYGVSSSKSSSSRSITSNLSDLETRYIALEQAIEKVNKALERNKDIISNATDLDKIQLLNEQNELYREQQNLLHQLNQERRKELAENRAILAKQGFKFDAEGMITNLSHIKGKSKKIEEVFQNYLSLLDKIRDTSSEWNDIMGEIVKNTLDIDDLGLIEFDKQIENINNQISLLGDIDTNEELIRQSELLSQSYDVLSQKLTYVTSKIEEYRIELEKLQPTTDANRTKIAMLKSQLEEFEKKKIEIEIELVQKKDNLKSILDNRLNAYKSVQDKIVAMLRQKYQDELEIRTKAINEELDALEKAHKEKIKLYEDEKKRIKELIDEKLKLIDREESERDYNQRLAELNEEKAEIQRKLEELSLDDSIESRNKQVELRKQLAEKEKEIAELVHDREVELRKDNLKDQLERYEKDIEAKIDAENKKYDYQKSILEQELEDVKRYYERQLEKSNLYHEANRMLMTQSFDELYRQLTEFEDKFGDGMTAMGDKIKEELIENLKTALGLINEINNGGSITAYTSTTSVKSGSTTTNQSKRSTDENSNKVVGVRSYLQSKGYKVDYDHKTKQVYVNGRKLDTSMFAIANSQYQGRISDIEKALNNIGVYSKGGKIDYTGLAMVHGSKDKPEYVFNYDQFKDLAKMIATYQFIPNINMPDFKSIQAQPNTSLHIDKLIEVQGNIDKSVLPDIEKVANKVVDKINSSLKLRGINRPAFGV